MAVRRLFALSILTVGMLVACNGLEETPEASLQAASVIRDPVPSRTPYPFTPVPFESLLAYPTPQGADLSHKHFPRQELPEGVAPPVPTLHAPGEEQVEWPYYLIGEKQVARFTVRLWEMPSTGWRIATISAGDEILAQAESERMEVRHAGRDITGEGHPDVVVLLWYRGWSYISMSTQVYDLGSVVTKVLDSPFVASDPVFEVPCPYDGVFADLEGDGSAEFLTCDDAPRWGYYGAANINPYAEHRKLMVLAVLKYEEGQRYAPAGPRFASLYAPNIDSYIRKAEEEAAEHSGGGAGDSPDALVSLAFSYLYSGQPGKAWAELDRLHDGPDKVLVWSEIVRQALDSPFYVAGGPLPEVPVPDYYTVALRLGCERHRDCSGTPLPGQPTCEPAEFLAEQFVLGWGAPISILEEGQEPCDADVALRSLDWLRDQLSRAGVIGWGESLLASSLDCTDKCQLAVQDWQGAGRGITVGFVELDASGGFPGEIVRLDIDRKEGARWRLRGDLTWEAVLP